jgi:hypothetical protein
MRGKSYFLIDSSVVNQIDTSSAFSARLGGLPTPACRRQVSPIDQIHIIDSDPTATTNTNPIADNPIADNPIADNPIADNPIADNPIADNPIADNPSADNPIADSRQTDIIDTKVSHGRSSRRRAAFAEPTPRATPRFIRKFIPTGLIPWL